MFGSEESTSGDLILPNPITAAGLFMLLLFVGFILTFFLTLGIGAIYNLDLETLTGSSGDDFFSISERNFIRSSVLIQHLFTFIIPGTLTAFLVARHLWRRYLALDKWPDGLSVGLATAIMFVAFPLVQFTFYVNKSLPLPDWARQMEASTEAMVNGILMTDSLWEVLFNLLVIAVIPAVGEEIVFRGLLQDGLRKRLDNPHLAIWLAAIIFSGFHMQFEGFIPRLFLGAVLGYLFYWTENLWVPIIAHFVNNGAQIIAQHLYQEDLSTVDLEQLDQIPIPVVIGSALLMSGLFYLLYQRQGAKEEPSPPNISNSL